MPDYQKMYGILMGAAEEAIRRLIAAQQACEACYLSAPEESLAVLPSAKAADGLPTDLVSPSEGQSHSR